MVDAVRIVVAVAHPWTVYDAPPHDDVTVEVNSFDDNPQDVDMTMRAYHLDDESLHYVDADENRHTLKVVVLDADDGDDIDDRIHHDTMEEVDLDDVDADRS